MDLCVDLYQTQTQKLTMTVQMRQAIEMLRCTVDELDQLIDEVSKANPVIEYESPSMTNQWSRTMSKGIPWDQVASKDKTMIDSLIEQIGLVDAPRHVRDISVFLIGLLDHHGYLVESNEELAVLCNISISDVKNAVSLIQELDPPGIGARDLRECLQLQVKFAPTSYHDLLGKIIQDHLEDVATGRMATICRTLKTSPCELQEAIDILKQLNPRPSLMFSDGTQPQYVVPELLVRQIGDTYLVTSNEKSRFRVFVHPRYERLLASVQDAETEHFIRTQVQVASWLNVCLEQRQTTLQRVATCIVEIQKSFFKQGPSALKPMTLRQIANQVGLHESTISRAVRGKYMDTPRGVIELKYFFTSEISGEDGTVSAQSAKYWIRQFIVQENPIHPLSDEALVKQMKTQGIHVSRRTVAKYREELHIPASGRRRRFA